MTDLNMTALAQSQGLSHVTCVVNTSTDGILFTSFIIALFFIMLLVLKKWDFSKAMLVSSWSCFLVSMIGVGISCPDGTSLLTPYVSLVFLLIAGLTAIYVWTSDD